MKKALPVILTILLFAVVAVVVISVAKKEQPVVFVEGNTKKAPLPIKIGFTNDIQCKMLIADINNSAEVISPDGKTWFFDDPGCMILWLKDKDFEDKAKLWVYTLDSNKWVDAKKAWYGIKDHTAMHYGFGAREKKCKECINFEEMRLRMLRGENLTNPKIRKKLLGI
jgi:nitrous oxide reductase accessory protein NosL